MIIKDIAQYEDSDSNLAKTTINNLSREKIRLENQLAILNYEKIKDYVYCFDIPKDEQEKYKEAVKVIDDIKKIIRGNNES